MTLRFGSAWTSKKLDVLEHYLASYTTAMKKQNFRLTYIDAFSGSGNIEIKSGQKLDGSAIRSLNYPFDEYHFFDLVQSNCDALKKKIETSFPGKMPIVKIVNCDCNNHLCNLDSIDWIRTKMRGVAFLDPYAMQLSWESLEHISNTKAIDVWYLFPLQALSRNLNKNGRIPAANILTISRLLGTDDWKEEIYSESQQLSFLPDPNLEKIDIEGLKTYIIRRLKKTFPTVSEKAAILKNRKNSPIFLLCFAAANPNENAKKLSLNIANHLLTHI